MHKPITAMKRLASDVGGCNACTYPNDMPGDRSKAEVVVLGLWQTPGNGREVRLCDDCILEARLALWQASTENAVPTKAMIGTSRPDPLELPAPKVKKKKATTPKLKVYGTIAPMPTAHGQQRVIVATTSVKKACDLIGCTARDFRHYGCVTGNQDEITKALSRPGTVFFQSLTAKPDGYWRESFQRVTVATTPSRNRRSPSKPYPAVNPQQQQQVQVG